MTICHQEPVTETLNKMTRGRCSWLLTIASLLCLLVVFEYLVYAQVATPPYPACKDGASPGVIQLTPDPGNPNKLTLARKHFYLSDTPFNLGANVDLRTAPSLRSYYNSAGASPQLIAWLEENSCETIYCRELTADEVNCENTDSRKCVPEFVSAYRTALVKLNGNQELARKWITNYQPLSSPKLSVGFYEARTAWLKSAVETIERRGPNDFRLRSAITDKDGMAFFYDLCPGTYYVSSIAPIDIAGSGVFWETPKPIKVEGPPDVNKAIVVTLAFPPGKDKKNFFVGKSVSEISQ